MKATFSILGIISLALVCLCIPLTGSAQQKSDKNSITKDVSLTHIDGNTTINLDLATHLGLTDSEIKNFADSLSIGVLEKTLASTKRVTIEILQPIDSNLHTNALVIREIKTHPAKDVDVQVKIKEVEWLNDKDLSGEIFLKSDMDRTPVHADLIGHNDTVLVKIYNTTKSRISLKNWQIRFTYGTTQDTAAERVIDRMSNVNVEEWKPAKQSKPVEPLYDSYSVTLSRKIDLKLLNDPTKTQKEQLSAISEGTRQTAWDMKKSPNISSWVEIYDLTGQLKHLKEPLILVVPNEKANIEDLRKVDTRIIIKPRKQVNETLPPTGDR